MKNKAIEAANKLNRLSGNTIDFFNTGVKVRRNAGKDMASFLESYSLKDLLVRGGIIAGMVLSAELAARTCPDNDQCSPNTRRIVGAVCGFVITHTLAIVPLIHRRIKLKHQITTIKEKIQIEINKLSMTTLQEEDLNKLQNIIQTYENILNEKKEMKKPGDLVKNLWQEKESLNEVYDNLVNFDTDDELSMTRHVNARK